MIKHLQRRTFTGAALALGLAATLSSWAPTASAQTSADIKKKGELTIGMLVDFPPYGTMNSSNQPDGYDADVARLMAKDLGVKVNLVPVTGPNRIPFLLTNKVDLLVASLAVTPERAKQVQFSKPYAAASIVVYGDKKAGIKSAADLKGKRVGVARASTQDVALTAAAPEGTEIRRFDDDASVPDTVPRMLEMTLSPPCVNEPSATSPANGPAICGTKSANSDSMIPTTDTPQSVL